MRFGHPWNKQREDRDGDTTLSMWTQEEQDEQTRICDTASCENEPLPTLSDLLSKAKASLRQTKENDLEDLHPFDKKPMKVMMQPGSYAWFPQPREKYNAKKEGSAQ